MTQETLAEVGGLSIVLLCILLLVGAVLFVLHVLSSIKYIEKKCRLLEDKSSDRGLKIMELEKDYNEIEKELRYNAEELLEIKIKLSEKLKTGVNSNKL